MIFTIGLRLQQDLKVDALKLEVVLQVIFFLFSISCFGRIGGLLVSTLVSINWVLEPHTKGKFIYNDKLHVVSGCFCHKVCKRFSSFGEPSTDFTCSECCNFLQEFDFRMRVVREDVSLERRGRRSIGLGH